jgi:hypothetical protein
MPKFESRQENAVVIPDWAHQIRDTGGVLRRVEKFDVKNFDVKSGKDAGQVAPGVGYVLVNVFAEGHPHDPLILKLDAGTAMDLGRQLSEKAAAAEQVAREGGRRS